MAGTQAIDHQMARLRKLGLNERQLEMNYFWSHFCATQYESRTITWDGKKALTQIEKDTVGRNAVLPMGHYDASGQYDNVPLSLRIPTAPHHLTRVVVRRFTGLLFSAKMHPTISTPNNAELQSWIETLCKVSRIWARFMLARNFGGGMGTVAMSFRFKDGKPQIDIHDARWCTPRFVDVATGEIDGLEIRYMYPVERQQKDGTLKHDWFWYRRVIDADSDVIFKPAPVGEDEKAGIEPEWVEEDRDDHGFGECPAVWIRNTPTDEMDGDPDCLGAFPIQEAIDRLISQADQGAVENADPTLGVASDDLKPEEIKKGSRNAFKYEKGASANYIEMTGSGVDCALKVADVHRHNFLELVQCILETEQTTGAMTATEVERRYSPMHERGDEFREQYGEHGIKPLVAKMIRATIRLSRSMGTMDQATGLRMVPQVMPGLAKLPKMEEFTDDQLELTWPDWVKRGPMDAQAAAGAVGAARSAQLLDKQSGIAYLAPYFDVDDPADALTRLDQEMGQADSEMMGQMGGAPAGAPMGPAAAAPAPAPATPSVAEPEIPPDMSEPLPEPTQPGIDPIPGADQPQPTAPTVVQRQALNGAQLASLMSIVERVVLKTIPAQSAFMLIKIAFPDIPLMDITTLVDAAAAAPAPVDPAKPITPGKAPPGVADA
jgi:hypothetical protein